MVYYNNVGVKAKGHYLLMLKSLLYQRPPSDNMWHSITHFTNPNVSSPDNLSVISIIILFILLHSAIAQVNNIALLNGLL